MSWCQRTVVHHLQEEAFVRAGGVVGRQVGGDEQELGVERQLDVSVSGQTCGRAGVGVGGEDGEG